QTCYVPVVPTLLPGLSGRGRSALLRTDGRERLDLVRAEAGPVVLGGDDDRGLDVAEGLDLRQGVGVLGDVDDVVGDARLVQGALGRIALHAEGLRVHGDVQGKGLSRALRRGAGTGVSQGVGGDTREPAGAFRSLRGPYRCDCVTTTPTGAPARQPLDVLKYKSVIHIALLTVCG